MQMLRAPDHAFVHTLAGGTMLAVSLLVFSAPSVAADAHTGVQAKPGDIVLLRNVSTRPAYRSAAPGMALIVDPSPRRELAHALGTDELSDADYADLDAASARGAGSAGSTVENLVGSTLGRSIGGATGRNDAISGIGGSGMAAPIGLVGRATGNIGNQVQGALSQLPGMTAPPTGGH